MAALRPEERLADNGHAWCPSVHREAPVCSARRSCARQVANTASAVRACLARGTAADGQQKPPHLTWHRPHLHRTTVAMACPLAQAPVKYRLTELQGIVCRTSPAGTRVLASPHLACASSSGGIRPDQLRSLAEKWRSAAAATSCKPSPTASESVSPRTRIAHESPSHSRDTSEASVPVSAKGFTACIGTLTAWCPKSRSTKPTSLLSSVMTTVMVVLVESLCNKT